MNSYNSYRTASSCRAVTESMTIALKAQKALAKHALRANVVKISSSARGCSYGIEFDCGLTGNVRAVLDEAGIVVKEYFR